MTRTNDIDQGWAWVVLFAAFTSLALQCTIPITSGLFQLEFMDTFEGPRSYISLVCSIHIGLMMFLGTAASVMCNIFSIRSTAIFGAAIFSIGLVLASFSSSFEELMLFYGVIAGCGSGLLYTPLCVICSHYFKNKRVIACGFIMSSGGFGYVCGPWLVRYLIVSGGWRSALGTLACLEAQICVLSALFFSLDEKETTSRCFSECSNGESKVDSNQNDVEIRLMRDQETQSPTKIVNYNEATQTKHVRNCLHNCMDGPSRCLIPDCSAEIEHSEHNSSISSLNSHSVEDDNRLSPTFKPENKIITSISSLSGRHLNVPNSLIWASHCSLQHLGKNDKKNDEKKGKLSCKSLLKPDLSVLKNKGMWCLTFSQFFLMCGFGVNQIHYPSMLVANGVDITVIPQLYMTQGISLVVARIIVGLLCSHPDMNVLLLSFGSQMLLGTLVFCMPFAGDTVWIYHVFTCLYATYYGLTFVVITPIVVQLLGLKHLATGFGLQMLAGGIAYAITPVVAGWIYDVTLSYNMAYHFAGSSILFGAIFIPMIQMLEAKSFTGEPTKDLPTA